MLCQFYGLSDIQLAEDIVSDTFLKAMKSWSHNDIPDNPKAWLRKVAQNKLTDYFRRNKTYNDKVIPSYKNDHDQISTLKITDEIIGDSQLKMMFVVCDPHLKMDAQLCLALRILCGFNIDEIAKALLSNKETINKKLYRAKKAIKERKKLNTELTKETYALRLDNVLRIIYLIFNEGYYSSINEENIRQEICWEAMRLNIILNKQAFLPQPKIHALLALMCFHTSRINARTLGIHGNMLYRDQDRSKWNQALIQKGEHYLNQSATGTIVSKYHLEAAIAYWHTTNVKDKWNNILQLYNKLLVMEYSPVIAMNRTYALAMANSVKEAIIEANKLDLKNNHYYYCLLAELYRMDRQPDKEISNLTEALKYTNKKSEQELIEAKIARTKNK